MVLDLVNHDHQLLHTKLEGFDFKNPPVNPIELANNLIETMVANKALGLSANQVGLPYKVFVLYGQEPIVAFNARLVDESNEKVALEEVCASYANLILKVKRPKMIKVRYQDYNGEWRNEKFTGMTARAFLHELDHMNGVDYRRRANPIHLQRAQNKQKHIDRTIKRMNKADK